jgi:PAS domain S-box-containing protein
MQARKTEALLASAVDGICSINTNGIIEIVNPALCFLFGYLESELLGKNVKILLPKDSPHYAQHDRYLKRYHENTGKEIRLMGKSKGFEAQRKDGSIFPILLTLCNAQSGGERAIFGFIRDTTLAMEKQKQEVTKAGHLIFIKSSRCVSKGRSSTTGN